RSDGRARARPVGLRYRARRILGVALAAMSILAIVGHHEVRDPRRDLGAKARSVEHAVMADTRLHPMGPALGGNVEAQPVRRLGLSEARDIVVLALDREQRDAADAGGIDLRAPVRHGALRQSV